MLMVTERVLRAVGLTPDEIREREREDDALGPTYDAEERVSLTRTVLSVGPGWETEERELRVSPARLPDGYVVAGGPVGLGPDEVRVRRLMIAAIGRVGSARIGGAA